MNSKPWRKIKALAMCTQENVTDSSEQTVETQYVRLPGKSPPPKHLL